MSSTESGKHVGLRRLVTETEPGQMARWDAHAARLGMTWAALVRALLDESMSMPEVIVYGIRAVGTEEVRFVGSTTLSLERRRKQGYPGKLGEWLAGIQWEYTELERTTVSRAGEAEARWVAELGGHGLLFNSGGIPSGARGDVRFPVALPPETHAKAVELAARERRTLGAFVQIAVERMIARDEAPLALTHEPMIDPHMIQGGNFCPDCGRRQTRSPSGWGCSEHGGGVSIGPREAEQVYQRFDAHRVTSANTPPPRRMGPRGSASNPNSAFPQDEEDLDEASA